MESFAPDGWGQDGRGGDSSEVFRSDSPLGGDEYFRSDSPPVAETMDEIEQGQTSTTSEDGARSLNYSQRSQISASNMSNLSTRSQPSSHQSLDRSGLSAGTADYPDDQGVDDTELLHGDANASGQGSSLLMSRTLTWHSGVMSRENTRGSSWRVRRQNSSSFREEGQQSSRARPLITPHPTTMPSTLQTTPPSRTEDTLPLTISPSKRGGTATVSIPRTLLADPPSSSVVVSEGDFGRCFEGEGATLTRARLNELGETGHTYETFPELLNDLRENRLRSDFATHIHAAMPNASLEERWAYIDAVCEQVKRDEARRHDARFRLLAYLGGSQRRCPLWVDSFEWGDHIEGEVARLVLAEEWDLHTLVVLTLFEMRGERFYSFEELAAAVAAHNALDKAQRARVQEWLNAGLQPGQEAQAGCTHMLWSQSRTNVRATKDDVLKLFRVTRAEAAAMNHIKTLDRAGATMVDMNDLIAAVGELHADELRERTRVLNFLLQHAGTFVRRGVNEGDVVRLFEEGCAGLNTLPHCVALLNAGCAFETADDLLAAVVARHSELLDHIAEVRAFLTDGDAHGLLPRVAHAAEGEGAGAGAAESSSELQVWEADRVFSASKAGLSTIVHLTTLDRQRQQYDSLPELCEAVAEEHERSLSDRADVFTWLSDPENHALLPMDEVEVTPYEVDRLFDWSRAGRSTLSHLLALEQRGTLLDSWSDLRQAVQSEHLESLHQRAEVLEYLQDRSKQSLLISQASVDALCPGDADDMFDVSGAGSRSLELLQNLNAAERRFSSVEALTRALAEAREQQVLDEDAVLAFLLDPTRHDLLPLDEVMVRPEDVSHMFSYVRAGQSTLPLLMELEEAGETFDSLDELLEALNAANARSLTHRDQVQHWLSDQSNHDLLDVRASPVLRSDVNRMFEEACAGAATQGLLQDLDRGQSHYATFDDLIDALREQQVLNLDRRAAVLAYLSDPRAQCLLADSAPPVTSADVNRLFDETGAGQGTMEVLKELDLDHEEPFQEVGALTQAVRESVEEDEANAQEVLKFLGLPETQKSLGVGSCGSASDPDTPTRKLVDKILAQARDQPKETLFVLKKLSAEAEETGQSSAGGAFNDYSELMDAVAVEGHAYHKKEVQAYLEDGEAHTLLPVRQSVRALITQGSVSRMFKQAGTGEHTLRLLRLLDAQGTACGSMAELTVHLAHMALSQDEVTQYLSDPRAHCLLEDAETRAVCAEDVRGLFEQACGGHCTLDYLLTLDRRGKYYSSWDRLVGAVGQLHEESLQAREELLTLLQDPERHQLLAPADARQVDARAVDALFEAAGAGQGLLAHVEYLDRQKHPFSDFDALAAAVRDRRVQQARFEADVLAFLSAEDHAHALGGLLSEGDDAVLEALLSHPELGSQSGLPASALLTHLQELIDANARVGSIDELLELLSGMRKRARILALLNSEQHSGMLLSSLVQDVTPADVDRMLNECHEQSAEQVLARIKACSREGVRFNDVDELIAELSSVERHKDDLYAFLNNRQLPSRQKEAPASGAAVSDDEVHRHGLFVGARAKQPVTPAEVDQLYVDGQAALSTLACVRVLNRWGWSCEDLPALAQGVQDLFASILPHRSQVLDYLRGDEHSLLPPGVRAFLRERDVEWMCNEGGCAGALTLTRLQELESSGARFDDVAQLTAALAQVHAASLAHRARVLAFLRDHSRQSLFHGPVSLHRVDALCRRAQAGDRTLAGMQELDDRGVHYADDDWEGLVAGFMAWHDEDLDHRASVKAWLAEQTNHQLIDVKRNEVTRQSVDQLLDVAGSGGSTLWLLQQLQAQGAKFASLAELQHGLSAAYAQSLKDRAAVLAYLREEDSHRLLPPASKQELTPGAVALLFNHCGSGPQTLPLLQELAEAGERYADVDDLADGLRARFERASQLQLECLHFLLHEDHGLMGCPPAPEPAYTADADLAAALYGEAGMYTTPVLRSLALQGHVYRTPARLLAAVRLARTHLAEERSLLVKWVRANAAPEGLLSEEQAGAFSAQQADRVLVDSLAGAETTAHVRELARQELQCGGLQDLVDGVSSRHMELVRDRGRVLAYLQDQAQHSLLDVATHPLTRKEVMRLFVVADVSTFPLLRALEARGQRFGDLGELLAALRYARDEERAAKAEALAWLRDSSQQTVLDPTRARVTVGAVDRLFLESGAGAAHAMRILRGLDAADVRCDDMDEVTAEVCAAHDRWQDDQANALALLRGTAGSSHPLLPVAVSRDVRRADVAELFERGSAGSRTLPLLEEMIRRELQYTSLAELGDGLALAALQAAEDRAAVSRYLSDQAQHSLLDLQITPVGQRESERVYSQGGAGGSTLWLLQELDATGKRFASVQALVSALAALHKDSLGHRANVLRYLRNEGLNSVADRQHLLPESVRVSVNDVDVLFDQGQVGKHTLEHLHTMQAQGRQYADLSGLVKGLRSHHTLFVQHKQQVLTFLREGAKAHRLLAPAQCALVTAEAVDELFYAAETECRTLDLLRAVDDMDGEPFSGMPELARALRAANVNRHAVLSFLQHAKGEDGKAYHFLLPRTHLMGSTILDVDRLFAEARTGWRTPVYLRELSASREGLVYPDWASLADGVASLHARDTAARAACFAFLKDPEQQQVLRPRYAALVLTQAHVDHLFDYGGIGRFSILPLLHLLGRTHHEYVDMAQVHRALTHLWRQDTEQRRQALLYLQAGGAGSALVPRPPAPSAALVDRLFERAQGGAPAIMGHLRALAAAKKQFGSEKELADALREAHAFSLLDRDACFEYLSDPARHRLLPLAEILGHTTLSEVDRLFDEGGAGSRTLAVLERLDYDRRQFSDMDELVDGVYEAFRSAGDDDDNRLRSAGGPEASRARAELAAQRKRIKQLEEALQRKQRAEAEARRLGGDSEEVRQHKRAVHRFLQTSPLQRFAHGLNARDVDRLFDEANTGTTTLSTLELLAAQAKTFGSVEALSAAAARLHEPSEDHQAKALSWLNDPRKSTMFSAARAEAAASGEPSAAMASPRQVAQFWDSAFSVADLQAVAASGRQFTELADLAADLRKRYGMRLTVRDVPLKPSGMAEAVVKVIKQQLPSRQQDNEGFIAPQPRLMQGFRRKQYETVHARQAAGEEKRRLYHREQLTFAATSLSSTSKPKSRGRKIMEVFRWRAGGWDKVLCSEPVHAARGESMWKAITVRTARLLSDSKRAGELDKSPLLLRVWNWAEGSGSDEATLVGQLKLTLGALRAAKGKRFALVDATSGSSSLAAASSSSQQVARVLFRDVYTRKLELGSGTGAAAV